MSSGNPYQASFAGYDRFAAAAALDDRLRFIKNTYVHLVGAIGLFVLIECVIFGLFSEQLESIIRPMLGGMSWLIVLGAFMVVSFVADRWARSGASRGMQYAGLGLYVVAEALIFVPLLWIANTFAPGAIASAGIVTAIVFGGLTGVVFITKSDFSFLRNFIWVCGLAAVALIVVSIGFGGIELGLWFSIAMVVLASACILYQTSGIMHHYRTDQHVAASLALFSSVALLFWYVLQIFLSSE